MQESEMPVNNSQEKVAVENTNQASTEKSENLSGGRSGMSGQEPIYQAAN